VPFLIATIYTGRRRSGDWRCAGCICLHASVITDTDLVVRGLQSARRDRCGRVCHL